MILLAISWKFISSWQDVCISLCALNSYIREYIASCSNEYFQSLSAHAAILLWEASDTPEPLQGNYCLGCGAVTQIWLLNVMKSLFSNSFINSVCFAECPEGKWGVNCSQSCNECNNNGKCDPVDGECRCPAGYMGEQCELSSLFHFQIDAFLFRIRLHFAVSSFRRENDTEYINVKVEVIDACASVQLQ